MEYSNWSSRLQSDRMDAEEHRFGARFRGMISPYPPRFTNQHQLPFYQHNYPTLGVPLVYQAANAHPPLPVNTYHHLRANAPPLAHQHSQPNFALPQRPPHNPSRSKLRPQATPYVPASERSLSQNAPSHTSITTFSRPQMASATPQAHDTAGNATNQPAIGTSAAQPVVGARSSRPKNSPPFHLRRLLTLPQVPYSNVWNPTPNASFNPSSSPWSNLESTNRQAVVATALETPEKASLAANTPKKAIPTPIIVTPPHNSPRSFGPRSSNWRARTRGANRSPSPLAQRSESSNMPVPMLYRNCSPSPRRSANSQAEKSASPKPSVKHLTCWWWHEKGQCRFSDDECLYAHHETGMIADAPRQVRPGEPAIAGRGLELALRRIASESGSLKSRSSSPLRSHTPSEADIPHSAVDMQNKNLRAENIDLRSENELLRNGIKSLYVSHAAMINNASQFRRYVDATWRELNTMLTTALNVNNAQSYSYPGIIGAGSTRQMNQQRQQTQSQIQQIAAVMSELEPKILECASAEWAARANMTKVVKDIESGNFGWDLAAAVAREGYAGQIAAAAAAPVRGPADLSNRLANMTL